MASEPAQVWDSIAELFPSTQDASQLQVFLEDEVLDRASNLQFDDRTASSSWPSSSSEHALQESPCAWDAEGLSHTRLPFSLSVPPGFAPHKDLSCPPRSLDAFDPMPLESAHSMASSTFADATLGFSSPLHLGTERRNSCSLEQLGSWSSYPQASTPLQHMRQESGVDEGGKRSFSLPVAGLDAVNLAVMQPSQPSSRMPVEEPFTWSTYTGLASPWTLGHGAEAETVSAALLWTEQPPLKRARSNASSNSTHSAIGSAITAAAADSAVKPVATSPTQGKRIVSGKGDFAFPVYKPKRRESFAPPLRCHIRTNALIVPDGVIASGSTGVGKMPLERSMSGNYSRISCNSQVTFFSCPKVMTGLRSSRRKTPRRHCRFAARGRGDTGGPFGCRHLAPKLLQLCKRKSSTGWQVPEAAAELPCPRTPT